jgi:hypothetical protein
MSKTAGSYPTPFRTAERLPTEADADKDGSVLAWDSFHKRWKQTFWRNVLNPHMLFVAWMPCPPNLTDEAAR